VRRIREKFGLTQDEFAERFGLSLRTVQEWEQGRAMPEGPARILLAVIEREPAAADETRRPTAFGWRVKNGQRSRAARLFLLRRFDA
jgi:transcriptional regulator with XRE-family HTH domain